MFLEVILDDQACLRSVDSYPVICLRLDSHQAGSFLLSSSPEPSHKCTLSILQHVAGRWRVDRVLLPTDLESRSGRTASRKPDPKVYLAWFLLWVLSSGKHAMVRILEVSKNKKWAKHSGKEVLAIHPPIALQLMMV
ncbi:hypothetical protein CHARACLAT_026750 [Characodon lateralis]|uniref:Uncharacterized protein n=1 Tax=Characodon lateralis TaxID=208331 RepID=A0ABU7EG10_9TELE|nr:hypothetical protein [Characodon lateralis]